MQVFRPYIDHARSAWFLDNLRLGRQRVEAKQVMLAILRRMGLINDGKRGWLNHPIVLLYYNNGEPYINDLIQYFNAVVREWVSRGFTNNIGLRDIEHLLTRVKGADGTPVNGVMAREYRRVLLLKDPCHYLGRFSDDEVNELINTEPVYFKGINTWIRDVYDDYLKFMDLLSRGIPCSELPRIFPKRK
ncbi:pyrimidine dimer DNA glycosylase/endonuclease V [Vulcanisaeta thermophila]|uniref:pyrimidine dimer DNA glycosylase/endonuclease V n=1 Tax=Vulcanisaeta thermophila TaxID=867917 RepID=UPI0008531A19|nr:pyrimidine dimer DNA glycosylase/endonuclease V [Vulcanisaeta thermophila]